MPNDSLPWWHDPPTDPEMMMLKLEARFHLLRSASEEGQALRRLLKQLDVAYDRALADARDAVPLAFFKPSYEQALMLNAWVFGVTFPVCFASNRIGKTTAFVLNALLWMFPNDPAWVCFQPYTDHLGRLVRLLPRPRHRALLPLQKFYLDHPNCAGDPSRSIDDPHNVPLIETSQRFVPGFFRPAYPAPPISTPTNYTIWLGAPDKEWHRSIMMRRWRDWLPPQSIEKWNSTDCAFQVNTRSSTNPHPTLIDVICKSYESRDEKWSGDAVTGIMLSEGFSPEILSEVKNRVAPHAFASWDYTPVEARNIGRKVQLAYRVFKRQEELPLRSYVFTKFRVADAPDHIIPPSKRQDMLRMWANREEGKARIEGDFFSSSRQLLSNLRREHHVLTWTFAELQLHVPSLRFFRSIDPGYDHPTACAWMALAPNNVWYVYRFLSEKGLTIGERARKIIELSHNAREKVAFGLGPNDYYWQEVHPFPDSEAFVLTVGDYHLFQIDQSTGFGMDRNYAKEGLPLVESVHTGPEARALQLDGRLDPKNYPYHTHPQTGRTPGAGIYFLVNEPGVSQAYDQMESLFWDMLQGGPNKGLSKDTVPLHGDDELDAVCQLTSAPYVYHSSLRGVTRTPKDSEPEPDLIYQAYQIGLQRTTQQQHEQMYLMGHAPARPSGPGCF